jgi:LPXTG-motif cell wall-anchored protein
MNPSQLPLRDVHLPASPPWWPPAPGWLIVFGIGLLLIALAVVFAWRRRRRRVRWLAAFDREVAAAPDDAGRLATLSSLLRRAARRVEPGADRLQGEAWLRLLDGDKRRDFSEGVGRVLLDGGFQRDPQVERITQVETLARQRFVELMAGRR